MLGIEQCVLRGFLQFDWGNIGQAMQKLVYVLDVDICRNITYLLALRLHRLAAVARHGIGNFTGIGTVEYQSTFEKGEGIGGRAIDQQTVPLFCP